MTTPTPTVSGPNPFYWRAFVSVVVVLAFLVLGITGVGLYFTPPGRIANWSGWTLLGLTKANWQAVHMTFGFLFLIAAVFHLVFNWKVLLHYLRSRTEAGLRRRREIAWAVGASAALAVLSVADVPPISLIAVGRETLSNSWSSTATEPPVPHAELLTLEQVATSLKLPVAAAVERLAAKDYTAAPDASLESIAAQRGVPPRELYAMLGATPTTPPPVAPAGTGMGWKTLEQIASELRIPTAEAIARLSAAGIEASAGQSLREIAQRNGRHAPDLVTLISAATR